MIRTIEKTNQLLNLAKTAVLEAGAFLADQYLTSADILRSVDKDIKLREDVQSENLIVDIIKRDSDFPILSEECGWVGGKTQRGPFWVIDPLDGSMNYVRKIPSSCLSIGLWQAGQPLVGVVYDFNRNELFSGIVGEKAWVNNVEIKVSSTQEMNNAVMATGFPSKTDFSESCLRRFIGNVQMYKKIRMIGSAALSLAYVAAGRMDAYYERDIMFWDVAGGLAIVKAAGGFISLKETGKPNAWTVFASNGLIVSSVE